MISFPNAKINIGLYITQRRSDGFHNLETVFFPADWCDVLEVIENKQTNQLSDIQFSESGIVIDSAPTDNLVVKAYRLLKNDFDLPPVKVHLHKHIPMGAGLGGGSADAAFMLKMLNSLFGIGLKSKQLQRYASQLGSDCAFFIENKPVLGCGKGDIFQPIELNLSDYKLIIAYPAIHVSTAQAYQMIQPQEPQTSLIEKIKSPVHTWKDTIRNDFEVPVFEKHPEINRLKNQFYEKGAIYAAMSGSGAAVYGIFPKQTSASASCFNAQLVWEQT